MGDPPHNWPVDEILPLASSLVHIPSVVSGAPEYSVKATPGFFTLSALNYEFKIDAPRPALWLEFLNQLFGADPESAETLQGLVRLLPDTRHTPTEDADADRAAAVRQGNHRPGAASPDWPRERRWPDAGEFRKELWTATTAG